MILLSLSLFLGVDALWISPIHANLDHGYHGYWPKDYREVNPRFGSRKDLRELVDAVHARGWLIAVDVVSESSIQAWLSQEVID